MEWILYVVALALVRFLQMLPLPVVAVLGRSCGAIACVLDARHRKVAIENLTAALGTEKSPAEIRAIVREHFKRLGENYCCAIKTASMDWPDLKHRVEFTGCEHVMPVPTMSPASVIMAIGHFGNFELYARYMQFLPAFQCATTYRALGQPLLNRLMQSLRERSGCLYFERRRDVNALRAAMKPTGIVLGLLADQHAGKGGIWLPFFGRECSTSAAPALFALRYHLNLHPCICYRVGLARWRIETSPPIPKFDAAGRPRPAEEITLDMNRAYEAAIRRDPANWFWVHKRWKPAGARPAAKSAAAEPVAEV